MSSSDDKIEISSNKSQQSIFTILRKFDNSENNSNNSLSNENFNHIAQHAHNDVLILRIEEEPTANNDLKTIIRHYSYLQNFPLRTTISDQMIATTMHGTLNNGITGKDNDLKKILTDPEFGNTNNFRRVQNNEGRTAVLRKLQDINSKNTFALGVYTIVTVQLLTFLIFHLFFRNRPEITTYCHLNTMKGKQLLIIIDAFLFLSSICMFFPCTVCLFSPVFKWLCVILLTSAELLAFLLITLKFDVYFEIIWALITLIVFCSNFAALILYFPHVNWTHQRIFCIIVIPLMVGYMILSTITIIYPGKIQDMALTFLAILLIITWVTFDISRVSGGRYKRIESHDYVLGVFCLLVDLIVTPFDYFYKFNLHVSNKIC